MEAFAYDLACIGDQDKGFFVIFADIISQPDCLDSVQCSQDNIFILAGISAFCMADAGAAPQSVNDEVADRLRVVAHDIKVFGQVKALDKSIDHERADRQAEKRIQSGLYIKYKESCPCDQRVRYEQGAPDIKAGIFLQDHGNDIRASAGSPDIKEDGGTQRRKRNGKAKLQHRLVGKRAVHREKPFHRREGDRKEDAAVCGFCGKSFSEDDQSDHQEDHAHDQVEIPGGDGAGFCHEHSKSRNASECEVICEFEKISPGCDQQGAECQHEKILESVFHIGLLSLYPNCNLWNLKSQRIKAADWGETISHTDFTGQEDTEHGEAAFDQGRIRERDTGFQRESCH